MINLFRRLNPVNLIVLAIFALILRIAAWAELPEIMSVNLLEPFARLMISLPLENLFSPGTNLLVALVLTLAQAALFNKVINDYNLLGKPTFLPALMFITTSGILTPFLIVSPPLICNFLMIWIIEKFLSIYRRTEASSVMFDLGMIVSLGTLIYFPFIAMFPLIWISLIIFRPFNWREWVAVIMGFITIYFFLGVFYYWNNSLNKFYQIWLPLTSRFPVNLKINLYDYIVLIPVIAILILAGFSLRQNFFRSYVQVRKSLQLLFFMFILVLFSFYLKPEHPVNHFILAVAPASVFMAYYFLHAKIRWFYESLYLIFAGFIIYFQLF